MSLEQVLGRVDGAPVVVVTAEELAEVKGAGEVARAHETSIGGPLEIIEVAGRALVHERMDDGRLLLRKMLDRAAADALVNDRLEDYDAMWESCGIHIDYGIK